MADALDELLAFVARSLVDKPDEVRVERTERDGAVVLELHVAEDDLGKVIGRGGRLVRSLRAVVRASGAKPGERRLLEIVAPTDWVAVGRVGRPHGREGAFVVERASESPERFAVGARVYLGARAGGGRRVEARGRGPARRPARPARGTGRGARASRRGAAGARGGRLVRVRPRRARRRGGGRARPRPRGGGRARRGERRPAPDLRAPRSRSSRTASARWISRADGSSSRRGFAEDGSRRPAAPVRLTSRSPMQLDVFTLIPHAFSWLTEHRPLAHVLGSELELRLWSYRDFTPLRAGQVDDEPYGGGAGMVLRVDVVQRRARGGLRRRRRPADRGAHAAGPPARPGARGRARGRGRADAPLGALRGLRRARRRAPRHGRRLDRPVRPLRRRAARDGAPRRGRVAGCPARSARRAASTRASPRRSTAASSTRTTRGRPSSAAGRCPTCSSPATTRGSRSGGATRAAPKTSGGGLVGAR